MALDVRSFWLIGALITSSCGLMILLVRRAYTGYLGRSMTFFGIAYLCLGLNYTLRLYHPIAGQFLFYVVGGTLVATCLSLELCAVGLLKQQALWSGWVILSPLLVFAETFWFTFVHRAITLQLIINNGVNALLMFLIARYLWQKEEGKRAFVDVAASAVNALIGITTAGAFLNGILCGHFDQEYDFNCSRSIVTNIMALLTQGVILPLYLLMISERLNRALVVQAMHDPLTGVYNRRAFEEIAHSELSGAARSGMQPALLLFDLDYFKQINDAFGHVVGDELLRSVASTLHGNLRDEDFLCRWGGDEFCALLPRTNREQAESIATRILQAFEVFHFAHQGKSLEISVSIGIAEWRGKAKKINEIVASADVALYQAKQQGRNRFAVVEDAAEQAHDLP